MYSLDILPTLSNLFGLNYDSRLLVGRDVFSDTVSVIAWLDVEYADGREEHFATDDTWGVRTSKILYSEIYHGETVDPTARIKKLGTAELSRVKTKLIPQVGELIHEHERIAPKEFIITPKGERVIDFGQNMTGYVEVRIKGERGGRIVMTHAEVLDTEGNFYNENLRSARSRNEYILSGGDDVFKPTFSFQGFRYIRLDEYPFEEVDLNCFTAVAVYSDIERTGFFSCGNAISSLLSTSLHSTVQHAFNYFIRIKNRNSFFPAKKLSRPVRQDNSACQKCLAEFALRRWKVFCRKPRSFFKSSIT